MSSPTCRPKFRRSDYDEDALRITQGKTGISLWLPFSHALKRTLNAAPRTGTTILADHAGRPFSYFKTARIMREERTRLDGDDPEIRRRCAAGDAGTIGRRETRRAVPCLFMKAPSRCHLDGAPPSL